MKGKLVSKERSGRTQRKASRVESRRLHDRIREDIVEGRLEPEARLVVADLAKRYGTSSNPVREALHQLQGEGIVVISHNRGARVRAVGEDFVRNIFDIRALIEPYLARWFVDNATDHEIDQLEEMQNRIEAAKNDFVSYQRVNEQFHTVIYGRHFNREAVELEVRQREVLHILSRRFTISRARWQAITLEHRAIIDAIKRHDANEAAHITEQHVRGACEHLITQMRTARAARETGDLRMPGATFTMVRPSEDQHSKQSQQD
jgi:DNA-binding GntR family transcriptional regulator